MTTKNIYIYVFKHTYIYTYMFLCIYKMMVIKCYESCHLLIIIAIIHIVINYYLKKKIKKYKKILSIL